MYSSVSSHTCKNKKMLHHTCRLYIADDVEYVEQDLEQLRVLFLADGQGLPAQDIEDLCTPVMDLLNVLQLETGILIRNFKDVCFSHFSTQDSLLCVAMLCHCIAAAIMSAWFLLHLCSAVMSAFKLWQISSQCQIKQSQHYLTSYCAQKSSSLHTAGSSV